MTVEVASKVVAGEGFDEDFFDDAVFGFDAAEDLGVERGAVGHGVETGGEEDLAAESVRLSPGLRQSVKRLVPFDGKSLPCPGQAF